MHQPIENESSDDSAIRQSLRRALARDLELPEDHTAVSATLAALQSVTGSEERGARSRNRASLLARRSSLLAPLCREHPESLPRRGEVQVVETLHAWWCIVAHTHALLRR